ncbi:MAG: hypothetical protein ACO3N7_05505 [Kiritimatiellia bacterium]
MKLSHLLSFLFAVSLLQNASAQSSWEDFSAGYLSEKLQIGLRIQSFSLSTPTEENFDADGNFTGGFLGSIYQLEEKQDYVPTLYLRYIFTPYVAMVFSWESLEVETRTKSSLGTDGSFIYSGPNFHVEGRYPNESPVTPYASLGFGMLSGDVDYNPEWHQNGRRNFDPDSTTALLITLGGQWAINEKWALDFYARYMDADFDVTYSLAAESTPRGTYNFPLENWAYGAAVLYRF